MTATSVSTRRTPPRFVIGTFWFLHRAMVRFSGGRMGLSQPRPGGRFGMLRLTTIGRRSGEARVAIVGYFEDGRDLVTLAMNGWADAEPAWWLNLQAHPDAVAELKDGPRSVRARVAGGEERDRLWAMFRDYPGWGDDLESLAARRASPPAVVVHEPRPGATEANTDAHPPTQPKGRTHATRT
jgi:deazaflavin-dependent oxidoreductase (nitroreductase family)